MTKKIRIIHLLLPQFLQYLIVKCFVVVLLFLLLSTVVFGQSIEVSVFDKKDGMPLIGANIYTPDFSFTTTTDIDGKATLDNLNYRDELIISYIGYQDLKIKLFEIQRAGGKLGMVSDVTTDTIVVVGRRDEYVDEIPYQVKQIKKKDIYLYNAQTAAEALAINSGIFIQKSQMGGGSTNIRGFEANRVLLVVDGVRMNNAIYRSGHLQNAISVDNGILEQVELIYGPGSLVYGSDAIGGVVHYRTKEPKLVPSDSKKNIRTDVNLYSRYASANIEKTFHFDLNNSGKKWGFISSFSISDFDALKAGVRHNSNFPDYGTRPYYVIRRDNIDKVIENTDLNRQIAMGAENLFETGYNQVDFLQKIRYKPNNKLDIVLNGQYSTSSNIPRYDKLTDTLETGSLLKYAEWYYGPQKRVLGSMKIKYKPGFALFDKGIFISGYQKIDEDRISRKTFRDKRNVQEEDVYVYSFTADFFKKMDDDGHHLLSYGVDGAYNDVFSNAVDFNIKTGKIIEQFAISRYPSAGSSYLAIGAYGNYRIRDRSEKLLLNFGLRYTSTSLVAKYAKTDPIQWNEIFYDGVKSNNTDISWAFGTSYKFSKKINIKGSVAKAFRAPNIDDFAKIRVKNGKITTPNINLKPEKVYSGELSLNMAFGEFPEYTRGTSSAGMKFALTGFYSLLKNAIIKVDSSAFAFDKIYIEGENHPWHDIQMNINANRGIISGVSGAFDMHWKEKLWLNGNVTFLQGTTVFSKNGMETVVPFDHIPPLYGRLSLKYLRNKFHTEMMIKFNGFKPVEKYSVSDIEKDGSFDRTGTSDNIEETAFLIDDNGNVTYAGALPWVTYNFYSSLKVSQQFTINLSVENIFDLNYRTFASGLSSAGRNFIISVKSQF